MPPDDELDYVGLQSILAAAIIRSGDFMALDRIALVPEAERPLFLTRVLSRAAMADPSIAKVLMMTDAALHLRGEIVRRSTTA